MAGPGWRVLVVGVCVGGLLIAHGCDKKDGATTPVGPSSPLVPGASAGDAVLVGAGDISECDTEGAAQTSRLLEGIAGTVFTAGDHAYPRGSSSDFACYDRTWGRHKSRTYPAPGNHDYDTPGAAPYYASFGSRAGPSGQGWYSFDVGAWHVVSLNSLAPMAEASAQVQWLRADLQRTRTPCAAAIIHHPLVSSGPNGDNPSVRDVWRALYDNGVDLVLSGHDHIYERHARLAPDGRPDPRGARLITIGTGGARLYHTGGGLRATTEARAVVWGVIKLTLSSASYRWDFITVEGSLDSGMDTCQ